MKPMTTRLLKEDMSARLRAARTALGLTSTDVADRLRLPLPSYSRYETEVSFVPPRVMYDLDRLLGITPTYLITGRTDDLPQRLARLVANNESVT